MLPCQKTRRHGFTLIELLVVIAIIAVLAAILFPVFAKARERAKLSTCTSNLKQVGMALNMYAQDYDGFITKVIGGKAWASVLFNTKYLSSNQVCFCPSILPGNKKITNIDSAYTLPSGVNRPYYQLTYGIVWKQGATRDPSETVLDSASATQTVIMNFDKVDAPANSVLMTEASNFAAAASPQYPTWTLYPRALTTGYPPSGAIDILRHGGVATALFVDGHVEVCTKARFKTTQLNGSQIYICDGTSWSML